MRSPNDKKLAENVPEIDLILGGHDHSYEISEVQVPDQITKLYHNLLYYIKLHCTASHHITSHHITSLHISDHITSVITSHQ